MDVLPRVLVAERHQHQNGGAVRLLVAERLSAWQMESLARLGHPCPDYFQIASIQKLDYYFHCLPSLNDSHDIHLPLHLMDDFLAVAPSER